MPWKPLLIIHNWRKGICIWQDYKSPSLRIAGHLYSFNFMSKASFACHTKGGIRLSEATVNKCSSIKINLSKKWTSGSLATAFKSSAGFSFRHVAVMKCLEKLLTIRLENIRPKPLFASNSQSTTRTCLILTHRETRQVEITPSTLCYVSVPCLVPWLDVIVVDSQCVATLLHWIQRCRSTR